MKIPPHFALDGVHCAVRKPFFNISELRDAN